jgi:Ser/Thr protein kinase RdoA (MazF antagonist)/murein DD-endopeptidase MepM/ murein hydrolase activator NlpD
MIVRHAMPSVTEAEALALAREQYGLVATARLLPGEHDRNFHLRTADGLERVLKIASADDERADLELQNRALDHLARAAPSLALPRVIVAKGGAPIVTVRAQDGAVHLARLLTYVPGSVWANVRPHTLDLLASLGRVLATVDVALRDFDDQAAHRPLKWDLARAGWIRPYLRGIGDAGRRARVLRFLDDFEGRHAGTFGEQRRSVIYNDANDHNVVVGGELPYGRRVTGLIDFGDLVHTQTIGELAIGLAYALMGQRDVLAAARSMVAGYHAVSPLTEAEIGLVLPLTCLRLCVSVVNAAYQREAEPENRYLTVSEAPAWELLERLLALPPHLPEYAIREACGLEPNPRTPQIVGWLQAHAEELGPVVRPPEGAPPAEPVVFDLAVDSLELPGPSEWGVEALSAHLFGRMAAAGAWLGIGRDDEVRALYTSDLFRGEGAEAPEWRTVHLGLDLFAAAGTPVLAPLDGVVEAQAENVGELDYGPTVVLRHEVAPGVCFFTLYGHLSRPSLALGEAGRAVRRGERIGWIGDPSVNGGWPPHVHFQIVTDPLDRRGDYPGVARPSERALWRSLSPDPNLVLRYPSLEAARARDRRPMRSPERIQEDRSRLIGPSLSVSYRRPLTIVRGYRQHLYDHEGQAYLDTVNNVAHVGHCHPRVVRAGQAQMAVLNTNTRYLHDNLVRYADRLVSMLPEPLGVCFFVCSGSEANELALRLARTHTGRGDTLVLDAAYHGNTAGLVDISPYKHDGPGGAGPPSYVHKLPMPDLYRGRFRHGHADAGGAYSREVAAVLETMPGRVGTFIAEPLLSCGGQIVLPDGYLAEAYRLVRAAASPTRYRPASAAWARTSGGSRRRAWSPTSSRWASPSATATPWARW